MIHSGDSIPEQICMEVVVADIIIIAIVAILFVLCIRKQIVDHKKGIPSCGLDCGGCSGGACSSGSCECQGEVPERFKAKKK